MARRTLPRQLPTADGGGGFLVAVSRIITDEQLPALLDAPAPRWELWLDGRWVPAAAFCQISPFRSASISSAPSGLTVVARPMPEAYCEPGERPADAKPKL